MSAFNKTNVVYLQALAVSDWAAATAYTAGNLVKPTAENGYFYECTTGGTSHATTEPTWPTVPGQTVTDGTAVWTCRAVKTSAVAVSRQRDGGLMFHDVEAGGNKQFLRDPVASKLFDVLNQLA
ncbi:MAG: hypothetical protein KKE29_19895 [Proteobacteria bacterium]|nr:hypothetical protein [Pseudomonadota bacterium]MBU4574428.1 hypothetical protein [Pseudomonadota bacterium]MBV1715953.1 hypothetical protein [Desulfarculus sp.]